MRPKGTSESALMRKWRLAVIKNFDGRCFFCGKPINSHNIMEAHHIIKRKNVLTKYDWRNGLLVCKYGCHQFAETLQGKRQIDQYLSDRNLFDYLHDLDCQSKQYFVENGITKNDFLRTMLEDLNRKIGEDYE